MNKDVYWMQRALSLARKGAGQVHPNPLVGSVLVRGNRVVAEGYHHAYGHDHAEIDAIKRAGARARGATLYVNLEPCAHWGRTPPCMIAVVASGIRRVVAAMRDPNPKVAGKGFAFLKQHKIKITRGVLEGEAQALNQDFVVRVSENRPFVTLKAAVSLDGKIATARGESEWITGSEARALGHRLRAQSDAIAVGIETVLKDNPSLTAHGKGRNPIRLIFDSRLRMPLKARVLDKQSPTWVLTTAKASRSKRRALERRGISVYTVAADSLGHVSLAEAAKLLAREGVTRMLVEGGGTLTAAFLEHRLADEAIWFIAPKIIGGESAKTAVEGSGIKNLKQAWVLKHMTVEKVGEDLCIRGTLK
jgi:diaminohydroxyphosphoribosylaminopyrimidine deaminase/5-amino-6-(5-phosphoribosylamino)uracil reductase